MNEIGRCRDCRWWIQPNIRPDNTIGYCGRLKIPPHDSIRAHPDMAYGTSNHRIVTGPDFGCVQFEAKDL